MSTVLRYRQPQWIGVRELRVGEYVTVDGAWFFAITLSVRSDDLVLRPQSLPVLLDYGWTYPKWPDQRMALAALADWDPDTEGEPPGYVSRLRERRTLSP